MPLDLKRRDSLIALHPNVFWSPKNDGRPTNIGRFQKFVEERYQKKFKDYWELHQWSVEYFPDFWESIWHFFKIIHSEPYTEVFDRSQTFSNMVWFKGAKFNFAENVFRYRDSHTALITVSEETDRVTYISYEELYVHVARFASALSGFGIEKGDRVAIYLPNRTESVVCFLAVASIGAMFCEIKPAFGHAAVMRRLELYKPKLFLCIDRYVCDSKEINVLSNVAEITKNVDCIELIVVVPSQLDVNRDISMIPNCCFLHEFYKYSKFNEMDDSKVTIEYLQVPFNHPFTVTFTAGCTGTPKAQVHSMGAYFAILRDFGVQGELNRDDIILNGMYGWLSNNITYNSLHLGLTVCLYDGCPFFKSSDHLWDLLERFKITYTCLNARLFEEFNRKGCAPTQDHKFENLRYICGGSTIMLPQSYEFIANHMREDIIFGTIYSCAELMGQLSGLDVRMNIYKGEMQCFALGVDGKCIDKNQKHQFGQRGELVIAKPTPSLPLYIMGDKDNKLFEEMYLKQYPGHFDLGDDCWINPNTKGFIILGRTDEILRPKGSVYCPAEIYFILFKDKMISQVVEDIVCVAHFQDNAERAILFVQMKAGNKFTHTLEEMIRNVIKDQLSENHVPDMIIDAPSIPYSLCGRRLEFVVKTIISRDIVENKEMVINPESLKFYHSVYNLLQHDSALLLPTE